MEGHRLELIQINYLLVHVLSDSSLTFDGNLMLEDMFGISENEIILLK